MHIAYRLEFKKWRATTPEHKASLASRQKTIQEKYWKEEGLLLDQVKQGHGTTNDGNTARRFFRKPEQAAVITGVDGQLITKLGTIMEVRSDFPVVTYIIDAICTSFSFYGSLGPVMWPCH